VNCRSEREDSASTVMRRDLGKPRLVEGAPGARSPPGDASATSARRAVDIEETIVPVFVAGHQAARRAGDIRECPVSERMLGQRQLEAGVGLGQRGGQSGRRRSAGMR
jgi:hypothetical protein